MVSGTATQKTIADIASTSTTRISTSVAPATIAKDQRGTITPIAEQPVLVAEKATTPAGIRSGYAIQVATVSTQNSAKSLADKLTKKGWPSYTKPSGKYVIVLAGNFAKQEEAKTGLRELKKTYTDCFIKKI